MAFTFDTDVTLNSGKILQTNTVKLPTESGGSTYGTGSSGQILMSNGSGVYWSGVLQDESIYYGTCSTEASTQQKAVTATNFPSALKAGQKLCVKFTNAQTYNGQPKLKVNSLDVKSICKFGSTAAARYEWQAGQILCFMYDGTNWVIVDGALANGNYPGKVKLSDNYTSSGGAASAGVGASSKAVYDAYTALNSGKLDKSFLKTKYLGEVSPSTNGNINLNIADTCFILSVRCISTDDIIATPFLSSTHTKWWVNLRSAKSTWGVITSGTYNLWVGYIEQWS